MVSSSQSANIPGQIYCSIRKEWVVSTPEEIVRQRLINLLVHQLKFPASHIVLEKSLAQMPHFDPSNQNIPDRRADIVCFAKNIHPSHALYPLLLIECKAVKLTSKVIQQVVGYNHFIKAYFIAVANQDELRMGWYDADQKDYVFVKYLPFYQDLMSSLKKS